MAAKRGAKKRNSKRYLKAASLQINGPGRMTAAGRRDIADWLRRNAAMLVRNQLTEGRYRAGYHYPA